MVINWDLIMGLTTGVAVAFLPFMNRALDKLTSSKGAKIGFILVETIEALEDGKLTEEELEKILELIRHYLFRLSNHGRKRTTS